MTITTTDYVHHGITSYLDYDRPWIARELDAQFQQIELTLVVPERQWLVTDYVANIWTNILAVFLTLATAQAFPILKRIVLVFWLKESSDAQPNDIELDEQEGEARDSQDSIVSNSTVSLPTSSAQGTTTAADEDIQEDS